RVKTEPAERQDKGSEKRHGDVVPRNGLRFAIDVFADPWSENDRAGKTREPSDRVHNSRSGEVHRAMSPAVSHARQSQPSPTPNPVSVNGIDYHRRVK